MAGMNDHSIPSTLSRRGLALLWMARDLSSMGSWVAFVALLAWAYRATESGKTAALLVIAWMILPVLLRPIAAALVRAENGWAVGSIGLLLRAAALFPLLTVRLSDDLQTVLVVALLASAPAVFVRASHAALLPTVVEPDRLIGARRALLTTKLLAMVVGATASVYLFRMDELRSVGIAVAAAFIASAVLSAVARPGKSLEPAAPRPSPAAFLLASQRALFAALRHPTLQPIAVVSLLFALLIGGEVVAKTAFVTWGLFMPNENLGFLLAAQGAGLVAALVVSRRVRRDASAMVAAGVLLAALAEFAFTLTNDVPLAATFNLFVGLGIGLALLGLGSMLRAASRQAGGEAGHALSSGLAAAMGVAVLVSAIGMGAIVDTVTARMAIALLSGALMILSVYSFGTLPLLKEAEKESDQPLERTFSPLFPD
jgi:hypothetical protein